MARPRFRSLTDTTYSALDLAATVSVLTGHFRRDRDYGRLSASRPAVRHPAHRCRQLRRFRRNPRRRPSGRLLPSGDACRPARSRFGAARRVSVAPPQPPHQPRHGHNPRSPPHPRHHHRQRDLGPREPVLRQPAPLPVIQCQPVCATSADRIIVPIRSATTRRNSSSSAGISSTSTSNCPSSTPILNESSDASKCDPANCSVSRSANENPKPWTSPKPNAIIHRRCTVAPPTIFSSAM